MNEKEIQEWKDKIDNATQVELAVVYRFSPAGHPCFNNSLPLHDYFMAKFKELGGMTPAVSKHIGWDR